MEKKQTQARMPADLHKWLANRAKQNNRSMNGELVGILEKAKEADEQKANQTA
jgi:predicted HicB family RNase H-like nuclease